MKTIRTGSNRNIPQRTCVSCRKVADKRELIRVVRNADGSVEIDKDGKKPGRGAYLCPVWDCWKNAIENGRLELSLRITLTKHNREQLLKNAKEIYLPTAV